MFKIKLSMWRETLDAYRVMEAFLTEKLDE